MSNIIERHHPRHLPSGFWEMSNSNLAMLEPGSRLRFLVLERNEGFKMRILFQGGWKAHRDPQGTREIIAEYCRALASYIVTHNHTVILTSSREFDEIIAHEIVEICQASGKKSKEYLLYLLPEREATLPADGRVIRLHGGRWWVEERTESILYCDALIAIGGGRGTFDCVEKALLNNKPVFVAGAIPSLATKAWKSRQSKYKYRYLSKKELETLDDVTATPAEFFEQVFLIIRKISDDSHSKRVFIVHGHDLYSRDQLAEILRKLQFEPIILADEPSRSLTIIEKLEKNTANIGFSFIIYTPDDVGRSKAGVDMARARQNVIFEHGLLIGLLGRERTCALLLGKVEEPSDIRGMLYERMNDIRGDALKVARVLKDAGYSVDASNLI